MDSLHTEFVFRKIDCRRLSSSLYASRPRYLSGLDCSGSESSLVSCPHTRPPGTVCSSGAGVRLTCEPAPAPGNHCTHSSVHTLCRDKSSCSCSPTTLGSVKVYNYAFGHDLWILDCYWTGHQLSCREQLLLNHCYLDNRRGDCSRHCWWDSCHGH